MDFNVQLNVFFFKHAADMYCDNIVFFVRLGIVVSSNKLQGNALKVLFKSTFFPLL